MLKNGIDLIEIERIRHSCENPTFINRVFGEKERAQFSAQAHPATHMAGAFAAKEAFAKALGTGIRGFSLCEVEVLHDALGAPYFALSGQAKALADAYNNLNKRFLDGQAGIMASTLLDGAPCPVCGSLQHPSPAKKHTDAPSEEQLENEKTQVDKLEQEVKN